MTWAGFGDLPPERTRDALLALTSVANHGSPSDLLAAFEMLEQALDVHGLVIAVYSEHGSYGLKVPISNARCRACIDEYIALGLDLGDPIGRRGRRDILPFSWTPYLQRPVNRRPGDRLKETSDLLFRHGFTCGASIPLFSPGAPARGVVGVHGPRHMDGKAFDTLFGQRLLIVRVAGLVAFPAVLATAAPAADLTLSERKVLARLALGQRPAAIAAALGKSLHTVRNQIASARARLGARSNAEAIAISLRWGLVDPARDD